LLLVDNGLTGLDLGMRREVQAAVIRLGVESVLSTAHTVEDANVSGNSPDLVMLLDRGRVRLCDGPEEIRDDHIRILVTFAEEVDVFPALPCVLTAEKQEVEWAVLMRGRTDHLCEELQAHGARVVGEPERPNLAEIVRAYTT
jgi:ABC-type multidrug transport system ATPase subunit